MRLLKGRSTLPYREAALRPLKEALQKDREDLLHTRVFLALANLAMCISAGRLYLPAPRVA
ncbi:MAG: hypothetical protein DUD39_13255 [Coriobacteriaceae bacterium]|nr:MAG: hypothetical protein DUD39_13255 [Coriobacteriaceae bacterium]